MKKILLLTALLSNQIICFADTIYKHNGQRIECEVQSVNNRVVTYTYKGEKALHTLCKYATEKIVYDSGREEKISAKIVADLGRYEDVIITENPQDVEGLTELSDKGPVTGLNGKVYGYEPIDANSIKHVKKYAARRGAFIVLIQRDDNPEGMGSKRRLQKKALCYTY